MRDGDIYRWRWADDARDQDCGPYRAYHCFSQIAVAENGRLCDTFWGGMSEGALNPEDVILTLLGNINDMTKIREYQARCYRSEDIVDMRHSNSTCAPIYLKPGAAKDPDTMLEYIRHERGQAEYEARYATEKIDRMDGLEQMVNSGNLDDVRF